MELQQIFVVRPPNPYLETSVHFRVPNSNGELKSDSKISNFRVKTEGRKNTNVPKRMKYSPFINVILAVFENFVPRVQDMRISRADNNLKLKSKTISQSELSPKILKIKKPRNC